MQLTTRLNLKSAPTHLCINLKQNYEFVSGRIQKYLQQVCSSDVIKLSIIVLRVLAEEEQVTTDKLLIIQGE